MGKKLSYVQKGCRLNDRIFSELVLRAKKNEFKTERDVSRFIKKKIASAGAGLAFPPIVAIAANAVDWHHRPTNSKLSQGGFAVIDFGSRFERYCSDMTRTIYIGKATGTEKQIYAKVLRANIECIKMVKAGKDGHKIYLHARKVLGKYAKYFGHGLGHGLKKIIHAKPRLSKRPGQLLHDGDIVTIEPGVYIPNRLGIRIEDDVLVTKNGYKLLSKSAKNLIEIKT